MTRPRPSTIALARVIACMLAAAPVAAQEGAPIVTVDRIVAVVGTRAILWSEVGDWITERRAAGVRIPPDSAGRLALARRAVEELVREELLVQMAEREKLEVSDAEAGSAADQQVRRLREELKEETRLREELKRAGFQSVEDYRRWIADQAKRSMLVQRLLDKLRQEGKLAPVAVTKAEVEAAFAEAQATLPRRPATVTFRQIVIAPRASAAAKAAARARAESLLVEIRKGGDFEQIARRESMDATTRETGGDLGWNRRGFMVREFDDMMFALAPGSVSPVVETAFGYHLIKVERVQPAEVKSRHILIRPALDSAAVERARVEADSVARAWREGASFDTLVARHNDPREYTIISDPQEREKLPPSYAAAFEGKGDGAITDPFRIEDPGSGVPKFVVAQVTRSVEGGAYTVDDLRETIRAQLGQDKAMRRLIDSLRKETYVSIRL